jgi:O-antigen biosynthesis protein
MWPLDLPARKVLKLPGETAIPWAVFEADWYVRNHPEAACVAGEMTPRVVLEYYLNTGQGLGHSPNLLFDEAWHRRMYPRITERMAAGHYESVFDAYCRRGALDRSAHWLFDELAYRERYPDLTDAVFSAADLCNGYDHYLRHGAGEGRIGHILFDPSVYLSNFDAAEADAIRRGGVFQHYLKRIEAGAPELRTSIYFDPEWYRQRYPDVVGEVEAKRWMCALHHYLCNDHPTAFDPLESFSEDWYLRLDPGLKAIIEGGGFRNGYMHFLRFGARELRSPCVSIDLTWYAAQSAVRADLRANPGVDAFTHWLTIGASAGLASAPAADERVTEVQGRRLMQQSAVALLPIAGRFGYHFECPDGPSLSVVMVVRNDFATTMATIASLRSNTASALELIVVDCGSEDETGAIGTYLPGAKVLRFETDVEWTRAADAGRQLATAPFVLFLSSSAQIAPGSVDRAMARFRDQGSVGALGGMLLQADGVIAAAGGIVWNNGGLHDFQHGQSALAPEANFVREVDFCRPEFLLVRAALLGQIGGFDLNCIGGYAAADLCLRIGQAGSRIVYDPSVRVVLGDAPRPVQSGLDYFRRKHEAALANAFSPGGSLQVFARHAGAKPHRILFIEDTVPLRRIGSGFVRANDLVRVLAQLGHAVTVFPMNGCDHDPAQVFHDMPDTVEVMHSLSLDRLGGFLAARSSYYDTIWVARAHNLAKARPILARLKAAGRLTARVILDTEAIAPPREAMRAALLHQPYDIQAAMETMQAEAEICQLVVAVTVGEAELLRQHGFPRVSVIGHMVEPMATTTPFAQRAGMLFVGAIHTENSPNLDGLWWFVDVVLPLIEAELRWETKLTVAGYVAPGINLDRFMHHPRINWRGPVNDLTPLYGAHRVFVAPTRYAAGAPYKVLEAASRGLPVVGTELLRGELGWTEGNELLAASAADPGAFASAVVRLYREETLWTSVRDAALNRLVSDNRPGDFVEAVSHALGTSGGRQG